MLNYFKFVVLSFFTLLIYYLSQRYLSQAYGSEIEYKLWSTRRYGFERTRKLPKRFFTYTLKEISLWLILPVLVAILSNGGLYFVPILSSLIVIKPLYRLGKQYKFLSEFEEAKISLAGPISSILLAILIKGFNITPLEDLVFVSSIIAISYMAPLPGLDGLKIFFGSRLLYTFSLIFILVCAFLLNFVTGFVALGIALLFALIALCIHFRLFVKAN